MKIFENSKKIQLKKLFQNNLNVSELFTKLLKLTQCKKMIRFQSKEYYNNNKQTIP